VPAWFARAPVALVAGSPCTGRHCGTLADGPMVPSWRQGVTGELTGTTGRAPDKEGAGGAHRGRWSAAGEDERGEGGPSWVNGGG
jgi:hypothetical protein